MFYCFLFAVVKTQSEVFNDAWKKAAIDDTKPVANFVFDAKSLPGSHDVREKDKLIFKRLNKIDDYPENEFICYSLFQALGISELIAETICVNEGGQFFPFSQSALSMMLHCGLPEKLEALKLVEEERERGRWQVSRKVGSETLEDVIKPTPILDLLCEEADKAGWGIECLKSIVKGQRERRDAFKITKITAENYGWHFIMALLLSLGDAKAANYVIGEDGQLIAIDNEMILRDAVVYYTARGPLCGLQSVLLFPSFRENFVTDNPKIVDQKVVGKIIKAFDSITPEEIFNVLDLLMNPKSEFKIPADKKSVLYEWCENILKYNDIYKFLDSAEPVKKSKSREELWWKLFEFSNRWNKIRKKLDEQGVMYDDLFADLQPDLSKCYQTAEAEQGGNPYNANQYLIYYQVASGLKHKGKEKLRRKLCANFLKKLDESASKSLKNLAGQEIRLAQFILGLMCEDTEKEESIKLYRFAAEKDGCFYAQNRLCEILPSDKAIKFFSEIKETTKNSQLLYLLGKKYEDMGKKFKKDAISCYKKSANMPNLCAKERTGNYDAQYCFGQLEDDQELKIEYYRKAAKQGHWDAQCRLFEIFCEQNSSNPLKYTELLNMFKSGLKNSEENAQESENKELSAKEVFEYLHAAARQTNYKAYYMLSKKYQEAKNEEQSKYWKEFVRNAKDLSAQKYFICNLQSSDGFNKQEEIEILKEYAKLKNYLVYKILSAIYTADLYEIGKDEKKAESYADLWLRSQKKEKTSFDTCVEKQKNKQFKSHHYALSRCVTDNNLSLSFRKLCCEAIFNKQNSELEEWILRKSDNLYSKVENSGYADRPYNNPRAQAILVLAMLSRNNQKFFFYFERFLKNDCAHLLDKDVSEKKKKYFKKYKKYVGQKKLWGSEREDNIGELEELLSVYLSQPTTCRENKGQNPNDPPFVKVFPTEKKWKTA